MAYDETSELHDLRLDDDERDDRYGDMDEEDRPEYSWSTQITFNDEMLRKLKIEDDQFRTVGDKAILIAVCTVKSADENSITLQMKWACVEPDEDDKEGEEKPSQGVREALEEAIKKYDEEA